jgi:hypothetical protein
MISPWRHHQDRPGQFLFRPFRHQRPYYYFLPIQWAAHAINKKGGILVDGKRKLIEVIKADQHVQHGEL